MRNPELSQRWELGLFIRYLALAGLSLKKSSCKEAMTLISYGLFKRI